MIRIRNLIMLTATCLIPSQAHAVEWAEVDDAGPVLATAQEPLGNGALTLISGTVSQSQPDVPINDLSAFGASVADVDLYQIFIDDPSGFSAETTNGDATNSNLEFDAVLALFDSDGFGVYLNDDGVLDNGNAILPAGNAFGPMVQGTYYLAIFDDNVVALSALNPNGLIFPDPGSPTQVVDATGPGGSSPLLDWFPSLPINASRDYTILLTGVTLPEPNAAALAAVALATLAALRRVRFRGPQRPV